MKRMQIYLSEFPVSGEISRHKQYKKVKWLIALLMLRGYRIVRFGGFNVPESVKDGYERIDSLIENSDCLLAIVDRCWEMSSWMGHEVRYANGLGSLEIPVFLYYIPEDYYCKFPREYKAPKTYTLPGSARAAAGMINRIMRKHR